MEEETKKNQYHTIQQQEREDNAKWVTHYSSYHQILLVGEGDFSFSLSLAKSFGSASNMVASSLNSYDDVIKMYKNAKSNLDDLHKLGACLLHGVDATKMKLHSDLKMRRFDQVIFNFPHAGFHGKEDNTLLIKKHKALVLGFFKNASGMLRANGEIHVSHKTTAPFNNWNIEKLAAQCFLKLIECADFKREDYPGYNNKRGDSYRCDEPFPLGKCCTFKFIYNPKAKRQNHVKRNQMVVSRQQTCLPLQEIEVAVEQLPTSAHLNYYPQTSHFPKIEEVTSIFGLTNRCTSITGCPLSTMAEVHGRVTPSGGYSAPGMSLGPTRTFQPMEPLQSLQPWPTSTNVRYSLTDYVRTIDNTVPISLEARNEGYQVYGGRSKYLQEELGGTMRTVPLSLGVRNEGYLVYGGRSNCFQEELARTTTHRASYPFEEGHNLRDTLLKWSTSTNAGYPMRDHVRSMDTAPSSLGARNEGYFSNVYGGSSNYWQEELGRTTALRARARASYSFEGVRSDFERYIAQVPGRLFVQSELHRMNILMQERRVFVES
ncbi:Heavy metal-associated isoprenylated plant protein 41 isoform B [Glycine soja]|uniref:Heavy metal-associated isoprenylated plant protein 41 isoform B n=1 Tax=Glycine soja TaxID=3848 RepID=A0A445FQC0_GLYSO|nr:Heavy metal-associated isoprenylated plant protein 41 isoform B [Glycine soja]